MVPREAPSSPDLLQETRLTASVLLEGKVRKKPVLHSHPRSRTTSYRPWTCQKATVLSEQGNLVREAFPLTHATPSSHTCLGLAYPSSAGSARRTSSARHQQQKEGPAPPGPQPAPSRRWPLPAARAPEPVAWRSSWRRGFQVNTLSTSAPGQLVPRATRSWQVGGAPPGDESGRDRRGR